MTSPRRKPRWSPEKRAAKGLEPNRPRGKRPAGAPMNRKERRAAEFGDARGKFTDARYRELQERDERQPRGERPRNDRPGAERDGRRRFERNDRPGFDRDDRSSFDRSQRDGRRRPERDDRPRFGRDDRSRYERDDRPRYSRDDRPRYERDDRPRYERDDRPRYSRDDRPRYERDDRPRYGRDDRQRSDRSRPDERPREDRRRDFGAAREYGRPYPEGKKAAREAATRPGADASDRFQQQRRRPRHHSLERDPSHRGHVEHRRRFDERPAPAEPDQMSWSGAVAEQYTGDLAVGFLELGVAEPLVRVLAGQGITEPFPIQAATIGDAHAGRDVLGRGRTGSGKTLAFGLPMLTRLAEGASIGAPRAVVLTPTRELALQIADNLSPLASAVGLDLTLVAGGMSYGPQIRAFERGVDVVIATPGRLIDLLEQGVADLSQVEISVLDEADHMADMGFLQEVRTLLDATPAGGQRLLFSATLDDAVASLVERYLSDPVTHEVDSGQASVTTMVHRPFLVKPHHKNQLTAEIANREGRTVLFARTQLGTDRIAAQLRAAGVMAGALHGGLTQGARARILAAFREGTVPVLVATDVAARGIHVDDVTLVLQVDPPRDSKDYLHRAGRTARAGQEGIVATIVLPHQRRMGQRLLGQAGVKAPLIEVEPGTPELREATGARTPSGVPIEEADYLALIAPKQQARRPGPPRGGRRRWNRRY